MFGLFEITSSLIAYAMDDNTSVLAQNGYDINGDGFIDKQDFDTLEEKLVNQISDISNKPYEAYWDAEHDVENISVVDLVRLKKVISSCYIKKIPDEFVWDSVAQHYVWETEALPVTDDGIATMKKMFKYVTNCSCFHDGSVELNADRIYAIRWDSFVDGGKSLPNPEKWIASYYGYMTDGVEIDYHVYIDGNEENSLQYSLMVSERYFDFTVQPYDGKWTFLASEISPSEEGMGKLQEYLSNVHSQQINELPDGSYEILVDEYYRLFFDKNYVQHGCYANPMQLTATLTYDGYKYSVYADRSKYKLFVNETRIGTAYSSYNLIGEVNEERISRIKELFGNDNYVEKVTTTNGQTQIDIMSFSGDAEYTVCVEPKVIYDAFLSTEVIANFYIDETIYNLYSSVRYDGQKFIYITMENRLN